MASDMPRQDCFYFNRELRRNIYSPMDSSDCINHDEDMLDTPDNSIHGPLTQFNTDVNPHIRYEHQSSAYPFSSPYTQPHSATFSTNESSNSTASSFRPEGYREPSVFIESSLRNVYDEPEPLSGPYVSNLVFEGRNASLDQTHPRWLSSDQFRTSSVPNINYASQIPFHNIGNSNFSHQYNAPPATEAQAKYQPFVCREPGCETRISKKGDLKRHIEEQHNKNKKRFMCGTCDEKTRRKEGYIREEKWKNHNVAHDNERVSSIFKCPFCTGLDNLEVLCFGSKKSFKDHFDKKHPGQFVDSTELSSNLPKRGNRAEAMEIVKRLKVSSQLVPKPQDQPVEVTVRDVEISDFFALSNHEVFGKFEDVTHTVDSSQGYKTTISFNVLQRSVRLHGPETLLKLLKKALEEFLSQKRSLQYTANPTSMSALKSSSRRVDLTNSTSYKTFPMRSKEDAGLLRVWHETIIPRLPSLLVRTIGNEYSASLVRKGPSQTSGNAVIQIQSHTIPSLSVQEHIRKTILPLLDGFGFLKAHIQFLSGLLTTLAGEKSEINELSETPEQDDEMNGDQPGYPFYKRYWGTPGPGASIGLLCTEQIAATICCYVNVDEKMYILTVRHFVDKSYEHLLKDIADFTTVVSPALADVNDMRLSFKQYLSDFEIELQEVMVTHLGDRYKEFVPLKVIENLPEPAQVIMDKRAIIENDLSHLLKGPPSLKLGTFEHRSAPPPTRDPSSPPLPGQPKYAHHLDWALCSVVSTRQGTNRHRYQYDSIEDEVDYYTGPTDTCGAGEPFMETCTVQANEKVHFVGQATGRQCGEINAARILISHDGITSEEWAMVKSPKSQAGTGIHKGDSGAGIIRDNDNKLVGLLWASTKDGQLVFSPINTVFEDIKQKLKARTVFLPRNDPRPSPSIADSIPSEVDLICRDKTLESPMKRRKFFSSQMPTPKRRTTIPKRVINPPTVTDPLKPGSLDSKLPKETNASDNKENNKYAFEYILTEWHPKIQKRWTFPMPSKACRAGSSKSRRYLENGNRVLKTLVANV